MAAKNFQKKPEIEGKIQLEETFFHVGVPSYLLTANIFASYVKVWLQEKL